MAERGLTNDVKTEDNATFADLPISESLIQSLNNAGFNKPSPIQLQALPSALVGIDLLIQAKSGTGKTLVFGITALEFLQTMHNEGEEEDSTMICTQVIILTPTREIAQQIVQVIKSIKPTECFVHTFIGGTALKDDQNHLKRCHIAVGTPGRIEELLRLKYLRADTIRLLILDEADVLLCKEFQVRFSKNPFISNSFIFRIKSIQSSPICHRINKFFSHLLPILNISFVSLNDTCVI